MSKTIWAVMVGGVDLMFYTTKTEADKHVAYARKHACEMLSVKPEAIQAVPRTLRDRFGED